jgi:hypothetical protein
MSSHFSSADNIEHKRMIYKQPSCYFNPGTAAAAENLVGNAN